MGYLSTILSVVSKVRKIPYRVRKTYADMVERQLIVSLLIDGGDINMGGRLQASSMRGR